MMHSFRTGFLTAVSLPVLLALAAPSASAETLDVPIYEPASDGQAANCGGGTVMGLKKGGDGFL